MYLRRVDAAKLVRLRAKRGLNRTALATKAGVSLSMLKYIEAGQKQPSDVLAEKIAKALHVEVGAFSVADVVVAARRRGRIKRDPEDPTVAKAS